MHNSQLHDVQLMIERTRDHGQPRARLFVERPEAKVVAVKISQQCLNRACEEIMGRSFAGGEEIIVNAPCGPDESVQNVSRRRNDVLFEPEIALLVGEDNSACANGLEETSESALCGVEINSLA